MSSPLRVVNVVEEEDPLANALGNIVSEQDGRFDLRLQQYASGTLSEAEQRELEEQAKIDPALAIAVELHRPLSAEFKTRLKGVALGEPAAARAPAEEAPQGAKVLLFRRPVVAALAAAAAVAAAFVVMNREGAEREGLPAFALTVMAGDSEWRSEPVAASPKSKHTVRADSEIELRLKPDVPVSVSVAAALYVLQNGQEVRSTATPEISSDGSVRWIGSVNELIGARTGTVTLRLSVGEAGQEPLHWYSVELVVPAGGATP